MSESRNGGGVVTLVVLETGSIALKLAGPLESVSWLVILAPVIIITALAVAMIIVAAWRTR